MGTYYNNALPNLLKLDYTKLESFRETLNQIKPDILIWAAGIKDLSITEANNYSIKEQNESPIIEILRHQSLVAKKTHLIFISSDYVFDGFKGNYKSTDDLCPNTNYGKSKATAEKMILKNNTLYTILRAGAVIGEGGNFFEWLIKELKLGNQIKLFDDIFSPTPINNLINAIIFSIKNKLKGIFHISGNRILSRYDFGILLKKYITNSKSDLKKQKKINFNSKNKINRSLLRSKEFAHLDSLDNFLNSFF
jgi:dTDP-4-dehydrorhamnose reductase